ncbi:MAG: MFS transporter [Alphaproteobacteria bacterium]
MSSNATSLSRWTLTAYGLPAFAFAMLLLPPYVLLPVFYSQNMGLALNLVGYVVVACRVFDAFTDPIIGFLSDRTRSRFGRRKIWIATAVPFTIFTVLMLFVPPAQTDIMWFAAGMAGLTLAWTMLLLPYSAWGAELSSDYNTRTTIVGVREGLGLAGTLLVVSIPAAMTGFGITDPRQHMNAVGYTIVAALVITVAIALMSVPDAERAPPRGQGPSFRLREIFANKPFVRLLTAYLVNSFANSLPATLFILFVGHVLGLPDMYGPLLLAYFLSAMLAIPAWLLVSRVIGKHRTWCTSMILASAIFSLTPFVVSPGELYPFLIITILTGIAAGADFAIPSSIQADVIDLDTLNTGQNRAGVFFAIWGVVTKMSFALAALSFPLLESQGFNASALDASGKSGNSPEALMLLTALYAMVPVGLKAIALMLVWSFPLGRAEQASIREQIEERQASAG